MDTNKKCGFALRARNARKSCFWGELGRGWSKNCIKKGSRVGPGEVRRGRVVVDCVLGVVDAAGGCIGPPLLTTVRSVNSRYYAVAYGLFGKK